MNASQLRRLFVLAMLASTGLLGLQAFWVYNDWNHSKEVLSRQAGLSFQSAIDREETRRRNILKDYLSTLLADTSIIDIHSRYSKSERKWLITMSDANNKKDYSSWSSEEIQVGPVITPQQKKEIIQRYVATHIIRNVEEDIIFFYTQRFGELWTQHFKHLAIDTAYVAQVFRERLAENDIHSSFRIVYTDTGARSVPLRGMEHAIVTRPVFVNYATVNDYKKKYNAIAYIYNPGAVLFRRLWVALLASGLLLALTLYCLYRMYRTIIHQKQLHELKNDFIGNMTHELKTPIATVTAAIDGLQYFDGLKNGEKTERYLNVSRTELQRLDEIVSKVLDISIYERKEVVLNIGEVELNGLIREVLASFEVRGIQFSFSMESEAETMVACADRTHLRNVLYNLVDNAVKYVPQDLQLLFRLYIDGEFVVCEVQDNGKGIDVKHHARIFEKFYRVPSGNVQDVKGFGLGLYYVKQIIVQQGGQVEVSNWKGGGSIFTIRLPRLKSI